LVDLIKENVSRFIKNSIFAKYKFNTDQKLNYMTIKNLYPAVILILISALLLFTRLNNRCSPIDADMPISIPFAGNSYVTEPLESDFIDNYTGKFKRDWTDENIKMSTYFRVGTSGELNIGFEGKNSSGTSTIRFTIEGKNYDIKVSGDSLSLHGITTIYKEAPGYVRVDYQGISKTGDSFGEITHFRIGGSATDSVNNYVTEEKMRENESNCYFYRRGASVHYAYTLPETDIKYFYNEIMVPEESAVNSTYFMMNGFSQGYMGMQQITEDDRRVLFSVWSPFTTDNPEGIPEEMQIKLLRKGKDVTVGEFGNEGSGGQSWLHYSWKPGETYKAIVGVEPDGKGNTIYTAYFYADDEWRLVASFLRPQTDTHYTGAHSFLENFHPTQSITTRQVYFKNQWALTTSGNWEEILEAKFTIDATGRAGMRHDVYGELHEATNSFLLRSFGFFDEHTNYGTMFKRKPTANVAPDIDFEMLESIPSV
jgi:hypothetical protein